jgi:hypothetical protein
LDGLLSNLTPGLLHAEYIHVAQKQLPLLQVCSHPAHASACSSPTSLVPNPGPSM